MTYTIPGTPDPDFQLVTLEQAQAIAKNIGNIGGGVTQIYLNPYDGPYSSPVDGAAGLYEFTFAAGPTNFNAGLIWADMRGSAYSWPAMLALNLNNQLPASQAVPIPPTLVPGPSPTPQAPPAAAGYPGPGYVMTLFGWEKIPTPAPTPAT